MTPSADRAENLNGPVPIGATALSPGLSVSRYFGDRMPKYWRQIWSRNAGYGSLMLTTTVRGSGASIDVSGPRSDTIPAALVAGSRIRSSVRLTALESSATPSWNFTSSRRVKVNLRASSSTDHFVARAG